MQAKDHIKHLSLNHHPEGGYYKENYRCTDTLATKMGERNISTAIYYLLERDQFSAFHRIQSDEIWHYYDGKGELSIYILNSKGLKIRKLGLDRSQNEEPQILVEAGSWFAASLSNKNDFVLAGCTVAPGFDFQDFEMAHKSDLLNTYPEYSELINELSYE